MTGSEPPAVLLAGVSKVFGTTRALDRLSLEVRQREIVMLMGPSGSGKSTALRVIAGLERPDGGAVFLEGKLALDTPPAKRGVAMVFQDLALYPHLTIEQNLEFGLKARGIPKQERAQRTKETCAPLRLTPFLNRYPAQLSGGEQQRAAIARAVVQRPAVLLMDEPMSNLDPALRQQLGADLHTLRTAFPLTIICVTHDQYEAMALGDRAGILLDGQLLQIGSAAELYNHPASLQVARLFGQPPLNLLRGSATFENGRCWFEQEPVSGSEYRVRFSWPCAAAATRKPIPTVCAFRPEHVRVSTLKPERDSEVARVQSTVFVGHETHAYLEHGGATLVARADPSFSVPAGELVRVGFDFDRALLFDANTGIALHCPC